jgi:hypothetical protein
LLGVDDALGDHGLIVGVDLDDAREGIAPLDERTGVREAERLDCPVRSPHRILRLYGGIPAGLPFSDETNNRIG